MNRLPQVESVPQFIQTSGCAQSPAVPVRMPPLRTVHSALRNTTEILAHELARPTQTTPNWSAFEWQVAQAVCAMHGVSAVLSGTLLWQGPAEWTQFLHEQRAQTARRYERISELLIQIDQQARIEDICLVALKGAELHSLGLYAPGERPMADVDLLVHANDGARAGRALEALGFHQALSTPRHRVFVRDAHRKPSSLGEHGDNYLKIELHERIAELLPLRVADITDLILPSRPQGGLNAYPSKAALMIHLLLHAAGAMSIRTLRLMHLNDLARLSANMMAADWDLVLQLGKAGQDHWWALPPLLQTARYFAGVIPERVLATLSACCPRLLSWISGRRSTLSDVSLSHLWIDPFPAVGWSQSPGEILRYAASRLWPGKTVLELRQQWLITEVSWSDSKWHQSSQGRRLLRGIVSRPPRVETMHTLQAALSRVR
jgi:hypothetical protein